MEARRCSRKEIQQIDGALSLESPDRLHRTLVCDEDLEVELQEHLLIGCGPLDQHAVSHPVQLAKKSPCDSTEPLSHLSNAPRLKGTQSPPPCSLTVSIYSKLSYSEIELA